MADSFYYEGGGGSEGVVIPASAPRPRLAHVTKWDHFDGYGFNLHAEKSRPGQFVGKVDSGSPAEAAGLREGDRIVEVNGVNISHENHKQVFFLGNVLFWEFRYTLALLQTAKVFSATLKLKIGPGPIHLFHRLQ